MEEAVEESKFPDVAALKDTFTTLPSRVVTFGILARSLHGQFFVKEVIRGGLDQSTWSQSNAGLRNKHINICLAKCSM